MSQPFDSDLSGAQPTSPGRPPVDETSFAGCYAAIAAVVGIFFGGFVGFGVGFGAFYAPGVLGTLLRLATIALTIAVVVGVRHLLSKGPSHMSDPERHARMMRTHQAMQSISSIMPATGISIDHLMFFFRVKSLTGPNISIRYYVLLWWGFLFIGSVIPGALTGSIVQWNQQAQVAATRAALQKYGSGGATVAATPTPTPNPASSLARLSAKYGSGGQIATNGNAAPTVSLASTHGSSGNVGVDFHDYWARRRPASRTEKEWAAQYYWDVVLPTLRGKVVDISVSGYPTTPTNARLRQWIRRRHAEIVCGTGAIITDQIAQAAGWAMWSIPPRSVVEPWLNQESAAVKC